VDGFLDRYRGLNGIGRGLENAEKAVAYRFEDGAVVLVDGALDQLIVFGKGLAHAVAEGLPKFCGPLYIREQQRNGSLRHSPLKYPRGVTR
jgi:hypothetical protein